MELYDIDLLENDYWDNEKNVFVLYYPQNAEFKAQVKIKDGDGFVWNCYLDSVKYLKKSNCYKTTYCVY